LVVVASFLHQQFWRIQKDHTGWLAELVEVWIVCRQGEVLEGGVGGQGGDEEGEDGVQGGDGEEQGLVLMVGKVGVLMGHKQIEEDLLENDSL